MQRITQTLTWFLMAAMLALLPGLAIAQTSQPEFSELTIELWPEYDQPSVLVIYRATLSNDTELPATVTFRFPERIEDLHAVAVERNGGLFNLPPENVQQMRENGELLLTLTTDSPNIHLEYYDPQLITKEGSQRQIDYSFTSDQPVTTARFQVQEPYQSQDFSISPPASDSFTDSRGVTYQAVQTAGLAPGDTVNVAVSYSRSTDTPSVQLLPAAAPGNTSEHAADIQVVTDEAESGFDLSLGYMLVGAGVILLLATGGYWWWSNRQAVVTAAPAAARRGPSPGRRSKQSTAARKARQQSPPPQTGSGGGYCYQCGTAMRADAKFCHVCGAQRREG